MTTISLLLLLLLAPTGMCVVVCSVGWWATVRPRLEHEQKMFALREQAKLNAVVISERHYQMIEPTAEEDRRLDG